MSGTDTSIYLSGQLRPGRRRGHRVRPAGDRRDARPISRAATCATGPTRSTTSTPRRTTGSSATAWCTASASASGKAEWYRNRYVGSSRVSAARGLPDIPGRNWNNSRPRAEHQRRRVRRHHVGDGRGRRLPGRADLRARDGRPQRLLRHAAGRVHRASQGRPRHRRDARDGLRVGGVARSRAVRRRRAPTARSAARSTSRCRA